MPNSIRTTSNTQATTNSTSATFKAGDSALCPSLGSSPFTLTNDPYAKRNLLTISYDGSYYYFDCNGYAVSLIDTETHDYQPSLFLNTPANAAALATLYGHQQPQASTRNSIDLTNPNDDEVVVLSSFALSNATHEVRGAAEALSDIATLLDLMQTPNVSLAQTMAISRIAGETAETWEGILSSQVLRLNETLSLSKFGKVEGV